MDVNTLRALLTLACFIAFVVIVGWAWSGKRRERFEDAARIPLDEETRGASMACEAARTGSIQ